MPSAAAHPAHPQARYSHTTWLGAASLAVLLVACGGEQAQAPNDPVVAADATTVAAAATLAVAPAEVAPQPYGYLWQQALRPKPWPSRRSAVAATPEGEGVTDGSVTPASAAIPQTGGEPAEDPDPYHALPPDLDIRTLAPYLHGIASWYGPTFHGKLTANGEIYNQYGLTAAHPVLPIGTKIEVENLENHRKVWVRVNDRGPYAKGRVLDLSKIAAQQLGMIENGTALVHITVLQWPENLNPNLGLKAYTQYVVQAAAYPDIDEAENLRERLQARFPQTPVMIDMASNGFFAVVAGPFDDETGARQLSRQLQRTGITNLVRRYRN